VLSSEIFLPPPPPRPPSPLAGHVYMCVCAYIYLPPMVLFPPSFPLPPTLIPPTLLLFLALSAETATQEAFREGVCESACLYDCSCDVTILMPYNGMSHHNSMLHASVSDYSLGCSAWPPFTACSANAAFRSTRQILTSSFSEMSRGV